jgi:hypothetical protein
MSHAKSLCAALFLALFAGVFPAWPQSELHERATIYSAFKDVCIEQTFPPSWRGTFTEKYCDCIALSIAKGFSSWEVHARVSMGLRRSKSSNHELIVANELTCSIQKDIACSEEAPSDFKELCEAARAVK